MATALKTITAKELKEARKGGFGRKKKKKPGAKAGLATLENWIVAQNSWVEDAKAKAKDYREKIKVKDKIKKYKT